MFVFPMLGHSRRFFNAGYAEPKYKLPLGEKGQVVFDHVISSFRRYFDSDRFVLMCRADTHDRAFLVERMQALGVRLFEVIEYAGETGGQAESVELSLAYAEDEEELFIFNIDTILYKFEKDPERGKVAGYLEVFIGDGNHWSFVESNSDRNCHVARVVEKERISDLCSNGLYYFSTVRTFANALNKYRLEHQGVCEELYVAPIYNMLIKEGMPVRYKLVDKNDIGFCGVPDEYVELFNLSRPS